MSTHSSMLINGTLLARHDSHNEEPTSSLRGVRFQSSQGGQCYIVSDTLSAAEAAAEDTWTFEDGADPYVVYRAAEEAAEMAAEKAAEAEAEARVEAWYGTRYEVTYPAARKAACEALRAVYPISNAALAQAKSATGYAAAHRAALEAAQAVYQTSNEVSPYATTDVRALIAAKAAAEAVWPARHGGVPDVVAAEVHAGLIDERRDKARRDKAAAEGASES